jgi:hypothetical protein
LIRVRLEFAAFLCFMPVKVPAAGFMAFFAAWFCGSLRLLVKTVFSTAGVFEV